MKKVLLRNFFFDIASTEFVILQIQKIMEFSQTLDFLVEFYVLASNVFVPHQNTESFLKIIIIFLYYQALHLQYFLSLYIHSLHKNDILFHYQF